MPRAPTSPAKLGGVTRARRPRLVVMPHSEKEIRRQLIESGAVDVMVAISPNFVYTVTLPVTPWFLDKAKAGTHREDQVLFLDARHVFRQIDRAHRDFLPEQIEFLANVVMSYRREPVDGSHDLLRENFPGGTYADVPGLCKVATRAEMEAQGWSLNPGRYTGSAIVDECDEDFSVHLQGLYEEFTLLPPATSTSAGEAPLLSRRDGGRQRTRRVLADWRRALTHCLRRAQHTDQPTWEVLDADVEPFRRDLVKPSRMNSVAKTATPLAFPLAAELFIAPLAGQSPSMARLAAGAMGKACAVNELHKGSGEHGATQVLATNRATSQLEWGNLMHTRLAPGSRS